MLATTAVVMLPLPPPPTLPAAVPPVARVLAPALPPLASIPWLLAVPAV
jgi:hypothetical protein